MELQRERKMKVFLKERFELLVLTETNGKKNFETS